MWITLTLTEITNSLTEAEQTQMANAPSAVADLNTIVQTVTTLIRGMVNAAKRNQGHLGPVGTIPDELHAAAIAIARFKFLTHLPGTQLITVDRRADKDAAYLQLRDVALGQLTVIRGDETGQSALGVFAEEGVSTPNPTLWPTLTPTSQIPWDGDWW